MTTPRIRTVALAVLASAVVVALAAALAAAAAPQRITAAGVGAVKLGKTYQALRAAGLLGKVRPGCPLGGPRTRSAPLRAPLRGSVDLTQGSPRRVRTIMVRGGAAARGVGIGARAGDIRRAFPRVRFDRATEEIFGITLARVPRGGGGPLQFALDTRTRRVTLIGVPGISFCE